jgi:hypothetical protein
MAWELFRRDGADGFEMMGVDGDLLDDAPLAELPLACEITIEAPSTQPEFIASTEAAVEAITAELGGRIAGTSRTATSLWVLVHLPSDEHAVGYTQVPLPAKASVAVAPSHDPDWTVFERLRPVDMEEQSMRDLAVMATLHAAGDVGGVRPIEHVVTGLTDDTVDAFTQAVTGVFPALESARKAGSLTLAQRGDPADITPDTWTIRQIAERFGATYDGWSSAVVAPAGRSRPWRRRRSSRSDPA